MPNIDQHQIEILNSSRSGNQNYFIWFRWRNEKGEILNEIGLQWKDSSEIQQFASEQNFDDIIRIFSRSILDSNGNVRNNIFDSLAGKTYRVNLNVSEVT
jgi:hypothetical protein